MWERAALEMPFFNAEIKATAEGQHVMNVELSEILTVIVWWISASD